MTPSSPEPVIRALVVVLVAAFAVGAALAGLSHDTPEPRAEFSRSLRSHEPVPDVMSELSAQDATEEERAARLAAWVQGLPSLQRAEAVQMATQAGRWSEAAHLATDQADVPALAYRLVDAPVPRQILDLPPTERAAIALIVDAVEQAQAMAQQGDDGAIRGGLLILRALEEARPAFMGEIELEERPVRVRPDGEVPVSAAATPLNLPGRNLLRPDIRLPTDLGNGVPQSSQPAGPTPLAAGPDPAPVTPPEPLKDLLGTDSPLAELMDRGMPAMERYEGLVRDLTVPLGTNDTSQMEGCTMLLGDLVRLCDGQQQILVESAPIHIDLGGDDTYLYSAGGADGFGNVEIIVEVGGNDEYMAMGQAQGVGRDGGIGIVADLRGDDDYALWGANSTAVAQGVGIGGGFGALVDAMGDDFYVIDVIEEDIRSPTGEDEPAPPPDEDGNESGGDNNTTGDNTTTPDNNTTGDNNTTPGDNQTPPPDDAGPGAETIHAEAGDVELIGQGAGTDGGVGLLLEGGGSDEYVTFGLSRALVVDLDHPEGMQSEIRPDGTVVRHSARSGDVRILVQGAAEEGGVGVLVDLEDGPQTDQNSLSALATTVAAALEISHIGDRGLRECIATAGSGDALAQGVATTGGVALHVVMGDVERWNGAFVDAVALCKETQQSLQASVFTNATTGNANALGQGWANATGVAVSLHGVGPRSHSILHPKTDARAQSICHHETGPCTAETRVGSAASSGQGAGSEEGHGIAASAHGGQDFLIAGAHENGTAWAINNGPGNSTATLSFGGQQGNLSARPLPLAKVQAYAETGGTGALVDEGGGDFYDAGEFLTLARHASFWDGSTPGAAQASNITGADLDKAHLEGETGIAVFADVGVSLLDAYHEAGNPQSEARNQAFWGRGVMTPRAVEQGADQAAE